MNGSSTRYCSSSLLKNAQTWRASPSCEPAKEMGGAFLFMAVPPVRVAHDAGLHMANSPGRFQVRSRRVLCAGAWCLNARTDGTRRARPDAHFVAPFVHDTLVSIHSVGAEPKVSGRQPSARISSSSDSRTETSSSTTKTTGVGSAVALPLDPAPDGSPTGARYRASRSCA